MIHHVSISARAPQHVAEVLAELMNGRAYPFPGGIADSFMAVSSDDDGAMIEVYPETVTLRPGTDDSQVVSGNTQGEPGYAPFHILLSVPLDRDSVRVHRIDAYEPYGKGLFLVRPDGYIGWAGEDATGLTDYLARCCTAGRALG